MLEEGKILFCSVHFALLCFDSKVSSFFNLIYNLSFIYALQIIHSRHFISLLHHLILSLLHVSHRTYNEHITVQNKSFLLGGQGVR
jgi:hypothetical protein